MSRRKDFPIRAATFLNILFEKCQRGQPFVMKEIVSMIGISANAPTVAKSTGLARRLDFHGGNGYTWMWLHDGPPTEAVIKSFVSKLENYGRKNSVQHIIPMSKGATQVHGTLDIGSESFLSDLIRSQAVNQVGGEFPENFASRLEDLEKKVDAIHSKLHAPKKSGSLLKAFFTH